jgi:hypothetical protein
MIPVYRTLQAAEQRTEGQLESIICPATGPALLVVRTDEGAQKFQVSKMSDVEFITYREDLTGEVACGPMKKPLPVFVTWKAGAAEMRIVVAVEFLPTR